MEYHEEVLAVATTAPAEFPITWVSGTGWDAWAAFNVGAHPSRHAQVFIYTETCCSLHSFSWRLAARFLVPCQLRRHLQRSLRAFGGAPHLIQLESSLSSRYPFLE